MFDDDDSSDQQLRYQRKATRIYIFLMIVSIELLVNYTWLQKEIHLDTQLNPTSMEYIQLNEMYPQSLSCECTSTSMSYATFIDLRANYHQVCSSDLISSEWIKYNTPSLIGYFPSNEYRLNAGIQFRLLSVLCQQAKQTIDQSLQDFLQTQFISSQAVSQQLFESQIKSLIQDWKSNILNEFLGTIELVRSTTQGNELMSSSNCIFLTNSVTNEVTIIGSEYSDCSCALSSSCRVPLSIFEITPYTTEVYRIRNFFSGCFSIESLLISTLECFYNEQCVFEIDKYLPNNQSYRFSLLDPFQRSPNETIELIVKRLMVDSWWSNVSFSSYYSMCAPLSCQFERKRFNDLFYIITTIISIIGGLSVGLKLFILIILRLIEKISIDGLSRLVSINSIKYLFICGDSQQTVSRLHFMLVLSTLSILYMFSTFVSQSKSIQIAKPSLIMYENLLKQFGNSLECSCSQISMQYESFLNIVPRFHEVCASEFISNDWIRYLYGNGYLVERFNSTDFRYSAVGQFHILSSLCQLSQTTINDSLKQLFTSSFISTNLLSANLLNQTIETVVKDLEITAPNLFLGILSLIRETTRANMLMTILSTSWKIVTLNTVHHQYEVMIEPLIYQGCDCHLSSQCVQPSQGMFAGCYPLESLFQATLQCLYQQECIDSTNTFKSMNISSLNNSRFNINETIESIVNQLMLEEYSTNISYNKYFAQCAPSSCSYSYTNYGDMVQGIVKLIALYGGLVIICRWIALLIVKLFQRRTTRVTPITD